MSQTGLLKILYLVHDLYDPAVHKRVVMLQDGGAIVTVAGFRRQLKPAGSIAGSNTVNMGQTYNGKFIQRLWSVVREIMLIGRHREIFADNDIIIARNLEMLAVAVRGNSFAIAPATIVYECLDIHRIMLGKGIAGAIMRWLEGWLAKRGSFLITSSPAFVSSYFEKISKVRLPVGIVENKVYAPGLQVTGKPERAWRKAGPPWKIGWFGAIRCKKSLQILCDLARLGNGKIEVIIRGRPATDQFENFYKTVYETGNLRFLGPYKNPDALETIYNDVHFTWAIDMFEEGFNSAWLLPNRLYEGGKFSCIPIAQENVETGFFLKNLGIGVTIPEPEYVYLADFFTQLTAQKYRNLEQAVMDIADSTWSFSTDDCKALVDNLRSLEAVNKP